MARFFDVETSSLDPRHSGEVLLSISFCCSPVCVYQQHGGGSDGCGVLSVNYMVSRKQIHRHFCCFGCRWWCCCVFVFLLLSLCPVKKRQRVKRITRGSVRSSSTLKVTHHPEMPCIIFSSPSKHPYAAVWRCRFEQVHRALRDLHGSRVSGRR